MHAHTNPHNNNNDDEHHHFNSTRLLCAALDARDLWMSGGTLFINNNIMKLHLNPSEAAIYERERKKL